MKDCNWCNLTEEEKQWLITENEHWSVYLADEQDYIGRCILISKRHCSSLSDLTNDEWNTLKDLIVALEKCFVSVLGATMCNWSCLLNNFYKVESPNPHLHIHLRPRYKNPIVINNNEYVDAEFGQHYAHKKASVLKIEDRKTLFELIKSELLDI